MVCSALARTSLSVSLSLSEKTEGEREKSAREAQPKQSSLCKGPPYKARKRCRRPQRAARCSVPGRATGRSAIWQRRAGRQPATGYQGSVSGNLGSAWVCFCILCDLKWAIQHFGACRLVWRELWQSVLKCRFNICQLPWADSPGQPKRNADLCINELLPKDLWCTSST